MSRKKAWKVIAACALTFSMVLSGIGSSAVPVAAGGTGTAYNDEQSAMTADEGFVQEEDSSMENDGSSENADMTNDREQPTGMTDEDSGQEDAGDSETSGTEWMEPAGTEGIEPAGTEEIEPTGTEEIEPTGTENPKETVTITFNYGLNEAFMKENGYKVGDRTYDTSVTVEKGMDYYDINASLPGYGEKVGKMSFDHWTDKDGDWFYEYGEITENIELVAHWEHTITYHAEEGHFFDGRDTYTKRKDEDDSLLDVSPCCYPAEGTTRAFVGWGLKDKDGNLVSVNGMVTQLAVSQDTDLYAMYEDGYAITFDVNLEGGRISSFEESYRDSDGMGFSSTRRDAGDYENPVQKLTVTYPKGVRPSEANYFWRNPVPNEYCMNPGEAKVEFSNWCLDREGTKNADYDTLASAAEGETIMLYAKWMEYWTITYDANRGDGYSYYNRTERVIKGRPISYVSTGSFDYKDYENEKGSFRCDSFNTKADGTGEVLENGHIPKGDETYYAQYKGVYRIYLDGNGGSVYSYYTFQVDRGEKFTEDLSDCLVI